MPTASSHASLMDDLDFVAELDKFDAAPVASVPHSAADPGNDDLSDVWESRATFEEPKPKPQPRVRLAPPAARAHSSSANAVDDLGDVWESRATFYEPAPEAERKLEAEVLYAPPPAIEERHIVRDVAGFLLMMALGGAAAVLVFHDRVALLLR